MICLGKKSFVVGIYQRMQHRFFVFEMMVDSAFAEVFELVENILNRGALIPPFARTAFSRRQGFAVASLQGAHCAPYASPSMMESNTPTLYIPLVGVVCRTLPSSVEEVPKESLQISAKKPESALPGCGMSVFSAVGA